MKQLKNIRWYVYWTLDFLKGSPVGRYYRQIKQDYELGTSADETRAKVQALIKHAVKTTNFYRDFSPDVDLGDLPIVNKSVYKERYDDFVSSKYRDARTNRLMYTSGSTGTPFAMIQDRKKVLHNSAASIFLMTLANYYIGTKQAFIRSWVNANRKSKIQVYLDNVIMVDTHRLDDEALSEMIKEIRKKKVKSLLGYSSSIHVLSNYLQKIYNKTNQFEINSIIPTSESLPDSSRISLRKLLYCTVRSIYANEENGIMGVQDSEGDSYYFDTASYYLEVLNLNSNIPADPGEVGRLAITDLYNYAFPIIRYENGDLGIYEKTEKGNFYKITINQLSGRKTDLIFNTDEKPISQHSITNFMWDVKGVKQFQFIQLDKLVYKLRINIESDQFDESVIRKGLINLLGERAELIFEYVNEIPVLNSGKRRYIINQYRCAE